MTTTNQAAVALRPYQIDGANWMHAHPHSINADDVGLGKTFEAIEAMTLPALVVTRNHLTQQWFDTLCARTSNSTSICLLEGSRQQRIRDLRTPTDITVANIEMLRTYSLDLTQQDYRTLICDEAHHLRNRTAIQSRTAVKLARSIQNVFLLTASPYYKRVDDIWHLLHIIAPNTFTSYWDFLRDWCAVNWGAPYTPRIYGIKPKLRAAWNEHIAPYVMMRTYEDCGRTLPPLIEHVVTFNLPAELQKHYTLLKNKWRLGHNPIESASAMTVLLRQLTMCHEKVNTVLNVLEDVPPHETVLLYVWYRDSAIMLANALSKRRDRPKILLITGQSDANERSKALASAQRDGVDYIVATQSALSEGANLQWMRYVVYAEEDYVAEAHRQTLARVQRDRGDATHADAPVITYYVRARRTIDETIARARLRGATSIAEIAQRELVSSDD